MMDFDPRKVVPKGLPKGPRLMGNGLPINPERVMKWIRSWLSKTIGQFENSLGSSWLRRGLTSIGEVDSIWEKIRASNPDLVLLDVYMKGKLQWEVLVDIKEENKKLPVIIATDFENYGNAPRLLLADGNWIKSYRF